MEASGWSYFTPYEDDVEEALRNLRKRVFDGVFPVGAAERPKSIAAYIKSCGDDGTHSILDIAHADVRPPAGEIDDYATAFPLTREQAETLFGTKKPTREDIRRVGPKLMSLRASWQATWVIVHDPKGKPVEYVFTGRSGD